MEIIGFIAIVWITWAIISGIVAAYRQNVRNRIAHTILDKIDLQREKEDIMKVNSSLNFIINNDNSDKRMSLKWKRLQENH